MYGEHIKYSKDYTDCDNMAKFYCNRKQKFLTNDEMREHKCTGSFDKSGKTDCRELDIQY